MSIKLDLKIKPLDFLGFSNYMIVSNGDVVNSKNLKILSPSLTKGYLKVCLYKKGKPKTFFIHRLIALAFIPNLNNKLQINHINGIKTDNTIKNLEWCTAKENVLHSYEVLDSSIRKEKVSIAAKNRLCVPYSNPMFGKKHNSLSKGKMRNNHADFSNNKHPKAREVICIETGKIFSCAKLASLSIGLNVKAVSIAIGKKCKAGNFNWRYKNEYKA